MSLLHSKPTPSREPTPRKSTLRVVPRPEPAPSRAPFVFLVVLILGVGLVGLLLLNTSLQRGSFAIHELRRTTAELEERQGQLEQRVARLESPEVLARRARSLGMVPNTNPVFLRLPDGAVLGDAVPASPPPKPRPTPGPSGQPNATATSGVAPTPGQPGASPPLADAQANPASQRDQVSPTPAAPEQEGDQ